MTAMDEAQARAVVCEAGVTLVKTGLVSGTWGNVSQRFDGGKMAITPSGGDYLSMEPEDIVIVNLKDGSYEGLKPSAEKRLHMAIYASRKDVTAVIHTHAVNASTVAAARREIPPILDDLAQIVGPSVRVADYALPGTKRMVKSALRALKGRNAALLANHGAVCVGRTMEEAFTCCEVLEKACKAFIEAEFLGGAKSIARFEAHLMHQYYLRKYSKKH